MNDVFTSSNSNLVDDYGVQIALQLLIHFQSFIIAIGHMESFGDMEINAK
eukprot:SAG31_NODE_11648_length_1010_cov_1.825467_1_plen_50_part_00